MSNISQPPENSEGMEDYLQYISGLDMSPKERFELLYIVSSILSHFVDQAFNVQTDQITLQSTGKVGSKMPINHARIDSHPENQTANLRSNGVESDSNLLGASEP